ncbi:hypothetical protein CRYUN_Cryun41cG0013900 [Craigia yunnanensis]
MPREVLHDVLIKVHPPKEERELSENQLIKKLFDVLKEKRYLVVLDDIWRIEGWNILKPAFRRGKKGSKILFTTRNKDVALLADPCNSPIELPLLNVDEGWRLFKRKAFPENTTESHACSREFEMLGREMVIKLNGILVLSYNDLPYYLKPCFLYLGHYPEDWEISKKKLIQLWIAEGFISPSLESGGMLMEDVAEEFLEELINRCLVQVGKRDYTGIGVKTCRIHDLMRDLCVAKAEKENFLRIIQPPLDENSAHSLDVTLTASMPRRIAIHPSKRVLKVVNRDDDMWHVSSEIGNLHHLRYLGLKCSGKIILPRSIAKLKSLHTLNVRSDGLKISHHVLFKYIRIENLIENDTVLSFTNIRSFGIFFKRSKDVVHILKALIQLHRLRSLDLNIMLLEDSVLSYPDLEPLS